MKLPPLSNPASALCGAIGVPVHLGLPADDPLWTDPPAAWTQKRIWSGEDIKPDKACKDRR